MENKWLGLRMGGYDDVIIEIENSDSIVGAYDNEFWCNCKISLNNNYLNFEYSSQCFTNFEIMDFAKKLKNVLDNKIKEKIQIKTMEPDLEFFVDKDSAEIKIYFSNGCNYYCLVFEGENIKKLYDYIISLELVKK